MRHFAFTLIEVMAVIVLLGLLAGATTWALARDTEFSLQKKTVEQVVHADAMSRMASRSLARRCILRFDIDKQSICRVSVGEDKSEEMNIFRLSSNCRIDQIVTAEISENVTANAKSGIVEITYSAGGRSASYAVRIKFDKGVAWVLFAGLTGQARVDCNEEEIKKIFSLLSADGNDAD